MGGISSFFHAIGDAIGSALGALWNAVSDLFSSIGKFVMKGIIEPIMNFLGFTDEDIYTTAVLASRIADENLYQKVQFDLITKYMKDSSFDAIRYAMGFGDTGENQFGKYYRHGKWDYTDYLPEVQLNAVALPVDTIKSIIENIEGGLISIIDVMAVVPFDEDWIKWILQQNYNYSIGSDILPHNGYHYTFGSYVYDVNNNVFTVTMNPVTTAVERVTDITEKSVTPGTVNDIQHTVVSRLTTLSHPDTGTVLSFSSVVLSSTSVNITPGTGETSTTSVLVSNTTVQTGNQNAISLSIGNHTDTRRIVVKYTVVSVGELKYWIYDPDTDIYPALNSPVSKLEDLEAYPIVMLRNAGVDISDYTNPNRTGAITKERYEAACELLHKIGVDVDTVIDGYSENQDISNVMDVFFMMGVSPSDTNPIVSRTLYEMFDFIYDKMPFTDTKSTMSASFKEDPFNAAISWMPVPILIQNEVIGSVGTCTHSVRSNTLRKIKKRVQIVTSLSSSIYPGLHKNVQTYEAEVMVDSEDTVLYEEKGTVRTFEVWDTEGEFPLGITETVLEETSDGSKDLIIKKQITATTTKTLILYALTSVNIVRRGSYSGGVSIEADSENFVIPLPLEVVNRLSFMEKTMLLSRSCHLVFYAVQHTHLRWYQTESFLGFLSAMMIGISLAFTFASLGTLSPASLTWTSVLKTIIAPIALQLVINAVIQNTSNTNLKIALSIAGALVGTYLGGGFSNLDFSTIVNLVTLPVKAADICTNDRMARLDEQVNAFSSTYSERISSIENILGTLDQGLSTYSAVGLMTDTSEQLFDTDRGFMLSPSHFYSLAIGSYRNFDMLYTGFYDSTVHNFCSNRLTLGVLTDGDI